MAIKPIVVGTDGSEPSLRAVDWAAREAVVRDVPLRIVSVCAIKPRTSWVIPRDSGCGRLWEAAGQALQEAGDRAAMAARGLTIDTVFSGEIDRHAGGWCRGTEEVGVLPVPPRASR